jgi:AraC-like DNA-binding protein
MAVTYEERLSDSPYIQTIWHTQAHRDGFETVIADVSWDMIIERQDGKTKLTVWGPMTKAVPVPHSEGAEHVGIRFKLGTYIPYFPGENILNSGIILPDATRKSFWLGSSTWQFPDYENVETFVNRLVRDGLLACDPIVDAALQGQIDAVSLRSVQRRFLRITGLTQRYIQQIERAQHAAALLGQGTAILDAVHQAGYADQQHMTKALRRFVGQTPAQIAGIRKLE